MLRRVLMFPLISLLFSSDLSVNQSNAAVKVIGDDVSSEVKTIHISFGNKTNQICIIWSSTTPNYNQNIPPRVRYGLAKVALAEVVTGKTVQFNSIKKRFFHRVVLSNLIPGSTYFYQIVRQNNTNPQVDSIFSFSVPLSPSSSLTQSFLVIADMGKESGGIPFVVQESLNSKYTSVFHIGDIAYDLSSNSGAVGDTFLSMLKGMIARVPYLTVPGDHESFDGYEHYRYRFSTPNQDWPMMSNRLWYSLDIGDVHLVSLVTEHFIEKDLAMKIQLDWLKKDLEKANVNRHQVPWIIILAHRPLYCSVENLNEDCASENSKVRSALEDILFTYGVDLVISGHEHCYERTWPVYKKRVLAYNYKNAPGPVHIIIGTFGYSYLVDTITSSRKHWSAFSSSDRTKKTFGRLNVFNKSHIFWEVLCVDNNQLMDRMWMIKSRHGPYTLEGIFPGKKVYAARNMNLEELEKFSHSEVHSRQTRVYVYYIFLSSIFVFIYLMKKQIYAFCVKKAKNLKTIV